MRAAAVVGGRAGARASRPRGGSKARTGSRAPAPAATPAVAAGWVAGLVEVLIRRPQVRDFEGLMTDVQEFKGFWRNKITRVLLVVVFANLGSTIGTITGGFAIASLL